MILHQDDLLVIYEVYSTFNMIHMIYFLVLFIIYNWYINQISNKVSNLCTFIQHVWGDIISFLYH